MAGNCFGHYTNRQANKSALRLIVNLDNFLPMKSLAFASLLAVVALSGGCRSAAVRALPANDAAVQAIPFTAEAIMDRVREAEARRERENRAGHVYVFTRFVQVEDLDANGTVAKSQTKLYRGFSDDRDQQLLEIDGWAPNEEQLAHEAKEKARRKKHFLTDDNSTDEIRTKKFDQFREKFIPHLLGTEEVGGRPAYIIQLVPNPTERVTGSLANRMLNQMLIKLWIDSEDYQASKIQAHLTRPVNLLAGVVGSLKTVDLTVVQTRLAPGIWVDETVSGSFNARVLLGHFRFRVGSKSRGFHRLPGPKE